MRNDLAERLKSLRHVDVFIEDNHVGTLAQSPRGTIMFQYTRNWLANGFALSPFSLPLQEQVFEVKPDMPDGIFGIFRDSLPDDWGRLLQDRKLAKLGVQQGTLSTLARLSLVGSRGLGALEYSPAQVLGDDASLGEDWDALSQQCQFIIANTGSEGLDALYARGSSSGGARPKVMLDLNGSPWIVKFPASVDGPNAGMSEYQLALLANKCGIVISEVQLIPSRICSGYFATKRFDRLVNSDGSVRKLHMASAAALLEVSPFDTLDYRNLMQLTLELTHNVEDCEQLFRLMCFNVAVGNCDDHARNFSFLFEHGIWRLSPAYDLTQDEGFLGEHAMLVNGKGAEIEEKDLLSVGMAGGISARKGRMIAREVRTVVEEGLRNSRP